MGTGRASKSLLAVREEAIENPLHQMVIANDHLPHVLL
jgi:hypothetical protein